LCALHKPKINARRVSNYKDYESSLNTSGLHFPLAIKHVKKFERLNPNISINVFAEEKKSIYPVCVTTSKGATNHINLLVLTQGEKQHYTLITKMSALLCGQTSKSDVKKHWCNYCLHGFSSEKGLNRHIVDCVKNGIQKILLPDEEHRWLQFNAIEKMLPVSFVIYADFESYLIKTNTKLSSSVEAYERHVPSGFCYYVVSSILKYKSQPVLYRGPNAVDKFLQNLKTESMKICKILRKYVPIKMTVENKRNFQNAITCYLCDEPLSPSNRVRDHCHLIGQYRGPCHRKCNLQLKNIKWNKNAYVIPVVFHNLRGTMVI
jgi:hypothetical protein